MKNTTCLLAAVAMIACALPVTAQDYSADPTYGTVNLSSGFPEDPYGVSLSSGGSRDASNLGGNCTGYIANAPDVRLNYDAGNLPLYIYAGSSADTTLVINAPDGSWYCDDDSRGALDPSMRPRMNALRLGVLGVGDIARNLYVPKIREA